MKKVKLIIGVVLLILGIASFIFIPGGFLKTSYQSRVMETEQRIEVAIEQPVEIPMEIQPLRRPQTLGDEEPIEAPSIREVEKNSEEVLIPTSIYVKSKSVFYEVYGILKDILSLIATIYGIMIAKKTLLEKKKT